MEEKGPQGNRQLAVAWRIGVEVQWTPTRQKEEMGRRTWLDPSPAHVTKPDPEPTSNLCMTAEGKGNERGERGGREGRVRLYPEGGE